MVQTKLTTREEQALALIAANPMIRGYELDRALNTKPRVRYAIIEGLRDKNYPIIGGKSGLKGYRIARNKKEYAEYAARERRDCIKRLKRNKRIEESDFWN